MKIRQKLHGIVGDVFGYPHYEIDGEMEYARHFDADRLDIYFLFDEIEKEFGIEFKEEDIENLVSINDTENYLRSYSPEM